MLEGQTAPFAAAVVGANLDAPYSKDAPGKGLPYVPDMTMFDICRKRVEDMDKHGITMQVISCASQTQCINAPITQKEKEMIAHGNVEKLLKLEKG